MKKKPTVLFLPGLGANQSMYEPLEKRMTPDTYSPRYIHYHRPEKKESLDDYARRMFFDQKLTGAFDCVVACSMGSMICQSALEHGYLKTKRLILLSPGFTGDNLTAFSKITAELIRWTPGFLRASIRDFLAFIYPYFRHNTSTNRLFAAMVKQCDTRLFFEGPAMIRRWRRNSDSEAGKFYGIQCFQFQGTSDPLISYRKICAMRVPERPIYRGNHISFIDAWDEIAEALRLV